MMKFVVCTSLLLVAALAIVQAGKKEDIMERAGFLNKMRRRLGRLNDEPFLDLYKFYAAGFVWPLYEDRDVDDYRNYLPSGDECIQFFRQYRGSSYKLQDLEKFVLLDACLGYLYENEHQEVDTATSAEAKVQLGTLKEDENLKALWQGTRIRELKLPKQDCIANLLLNSIIARYQFSAVRCNHHFVQVYLQFAECQEEAKISAEDREQDTYLKYIYNLLKDRVGVCVQDEIDHIERAVRSAYDKAKTQHLSEIINPWSSKAQQTKKRMWPKEIETLLSAVKNFKGPVILRDTHELIVGVLAEREEYRKILLDNMAEYATKKLKPNPKNLRKDPTGANMYEKLVDNLCRFFRASDDESDYDYATPMIRLVQLLKYEDLFGVSQKEFVEKFLIHAKETAPMYISVEACNILTYTEGVIKTPNANTRNKYVVMFKPDTSGMVKWPMASYV